MRRWLGDAVDFMQKTQLNSEKSGGEHLESIVREEPMLVFLGKREYYSCVIPQIPSEDATQADIQRNLEIAHLTKRNMLVR